MYMSQVEEIERKLKHKLRPYNAYLNAKGLDPPSAFQLEELHQFLIGLYGDYVIQSTTYKYHKVLRRPDLVLKLLPTWSATTCWLVCGHCCGTACHLQIHHHGILNGASYWKIFR